MLSDESESYEILGHACLLISDMLKNASHKT
jgi:hypothetical protein